MKFNVTPIIDVVFLLIIFFVVVCKFIEAENFQVEIPDSCQFAQSNTPQINRKVTVTLIKQAPDRVDFAVGPKIVSASRLSALVEKMTRLIDVQLNTLPFEQRVVVLRVDKDICFAQSQYALAAIAASTATNIELAALKDRHITVE